MKHCPVCRCTVNEDNECPICGTTLTYEPTDFDAERERFVMSRHLALYLFGKAWFSCLCAVIAVYELISSGVGFSYITAVIIMMIDYALFSSFFYRLDIRLLQRIWSGKYAYYKNLISRYVVPATAVILSIMVR